MIRDWKTACAVGVLLNNIVKHMKEQKEKKSYRVRGFRLNDATWEKLKEKRGGVSWNKFLLTVVSNLK